MYYQNNNCMKSKFSARQLQLLVTLRRLWVEHVMWTRSFILSTALNLGDLDSVTKRLLRNPADFASVLKLLYGQQTAKQFENLFTDHLLIAAQLVNAAKEGNTKSFTEQREEWYKNATDIANFLGDINPYFNKNNWQDMLFEHLKLTENEAVQLLSEQYAMSIDQFDLIQEQALKMADNMTNGIIMHLGI